MAGRGKALSLYKSILRAHERYLPSAMRLMGDQYVKAEFRLHKTAKPDEVVHFYTEWEQYLAHIEQTGREIHSIDVGLVEPSSDPNGRRSFGKDIDRDLSFSDDQQTQLEKLREEAAKVGGNN
ncbi:hypothetical protein ACHAXT_012294 [Thalassiosira profunda]